MTDAEKLKDQGNEFFKDGKFMKAIDLYTQSLEIEPNAAVFCNRAFCHLKLEAFGLALNDANSSIDLDPQFVKGYYRRATAHLSLGKNEEALKDLKRVVTICPSDKAARQKYLQCEKEVKAARFLKAIESKDSLAVSETIDLESLAVPESYDGPRLSPSGITRQFVLDTINHLKEQKSLHKRYVIEILIAAKKLFANTPNCVQIQVPADGHITVCGDVHGQYYDLLHIWEMNGMPSEDNPYLFNGDFVDRGSFSVECVLVLLCWKLLLPNHFIMHRGNHEGRTLNKVYGFEGEVKAKYDDKVFSIFQEVFDWLPLCTVINNTVFVVHGGLFKKDGITISDIQKVSRNHDIPDDGLMCEMLWSDPSPLSGRSPNKRGVGVAFGADVTENFLKTNNFSLVVRSHEVKDEGYEVDHGGKLITVFSAPNYCDQIGNKGAFIKFNGNDMKPNIISFAASPHPPVKPMQYSCFPGMT